MSNFVHFWTEIFNYFTLQSYQHLFTEFFHKIDSSEMAYNFLFYFYYIQRQRSSDIFAQVEFALLYLQKIPTELSSIRTNR